MVIGRQSKSSTFESTYDNKIFEFILYVFRMEILFIFFHYKVRVFFLGILTVPFECV